MSELNAYVCCVCVQEKLENRVRMLEKTEVNDADTCRVELLTVAEMQKFTLSRTHAPVYDFFSTFNRT